MLLGVLAGARGGQQHGLVVQVSDDGAGGLLSKASGLETDGAGTEEPLSITAVDSNTPSSTSTTEFSVILFSSLPSRLRRTRAGVSTLLVETAHRGTSPLNCRRSLRCERFLLRDVTTFGRPSIEVRRSFRALARSGEPLPTTDTTFSGAYGVLTTHCTKTTVHSADSGNCLAAANAESQRSPVYAWLRRLSECSANRSLPCCFRSAS